jgi:CheY-like chemotaxis protein
MVSSVLLIDDDEDDRDFFLEAVSNAHPEIKCTTAVNGQDGLEALVEQKVRPDLIFLDLNMPLMNGQQFLTEIKSRSKFTAIPIVILSTSSDQATINEAMRLGAKAFITKPDKLSAWEKTISDFLKRSI